MIKITKQENNIVLKYEPDYTQRNWIKEAFLKDDYIHLAKKSFTLGKENLMEMIEDSNAEVEYYLFLIGTLKDKYYEIDKDILELDNSLFLYKELKIDKKTFLATNNISIFNKIDELVSEPIVIGGDKDNVIPLDEFEVLQKLFPTSTTLQHFAQSRISIIIKNYLHSTTDAEENLEKHFNRQQKSADNLYGNKNEKPLIKVEALRIYELEKYRYIKHSVEAMLKDSDSYSEHDWQTIIIEFVLLLFPKYVAVIKEMEIKDYYTNPPKVLSRRVDFGLIDANGNVDIIEIKKPFKDVLLYKRRYRDNYTPKKDLSGTIMQVEKYIFHLNKWGVAGEKKLNEKYHTIIPTDMKIKVINPKAMIIMGRDNEFRDDQRFDFSIIKKQTTNIIDFMTYDDLLKRLSNIIEKFETKHMNEDN